MKAAFTSMLLLIGTCLAEHPPPFLFPGALRIEPRERDWLVQQADGSMELATASFHEGFTFAEQFWRHSGNLMRWEDGAGQLWVLSASTWTLDRRASLHFNGNEAVLIDSGIRYTWRASFDGSWRLVYSVAVVPAGVQATGTIQDMCSRKLAALRNRPRTKSRWKNKRY